MNRANIQEVAEDFRRVIKNEKVVKREHFFEAQANYVLVGLRRAGKSTLLYQKVQELVASGVEWNQIMYINFEDERLDGFTLSDFNDIVTAQSEISEKKGYFFMDEIQIVPGWEKFARRMADQKEFIWITGSNSRMLSGEIASTLGGRFLVQEIAPYSFAEFLRANDFLEAEGTKMLSTKEKGRISALFSEYKTNGGFPEILKFSNKREYASTVYQKILLGDIATRHQIRNINALKSLIKKIAETVQNDVSYSKLANTLKTIGLSLSKNSVIDYISYATESYLIFTVKNYFSKFAERESNVKYYFGDNALLHLFLDDKNTALLENLVALTLRKTYKDDVYFLRSSETGVDVDFFVESERLAIQVCQNLDENAREREIQSLVKLAKKFSEAKRFWILTEAQEETIEVDGITIEVICVWKWLLGRNGQ